ncbi:hypothetical protein Tco_0207362, partial [Tanacetum coccineum]
MADNRTMAQMLQAPIEGYEDAIVVWYEIDIQEKEQKESQKQAKPSTEWKGQSQ